MGLSRSRAAHRHDVALGGEKGASGNVAHQHFVDRRADKREAVEFAGERQPGSNHLVFDGTGVLLGDLRLQQVANDVLDGVVRLDGVRNDLVKA